MNRKRTQILCGACALLALPGMAWAASFGPAEPQAWRFAHAEAQILAGIDLRKLAETAEGRRVRERVAAALGAPLLAHAERLLLSTVAEADGRRADLLILSGSFTLPVLRRLATGEGAAMLSYKGLEIAARPGSRAGDPHLAWMTGAGGGTTVLIGTRPAVQAAAERSKANAESLASVNTLFARAADLSREYPVWVASEAIPGSFGPRSLDPLAEATESSGKGRIAGFDIGVQAAPPALNLWVWTSNEDTAKLVLERFTAAAAMREQFALAPFLPAMKADVEDSTLILGSGIAPGLLADRVVPLLAALGLPVDVRPAPPAVKKPEADPPAQVAPNPLFIRIHGLADGTREIPYSKQP